MGDVLITTRLGAERRACLEALDVIRFLGGAGECSTPPFRGVVLLRADIPVDLFYEGIARYILSYAKRVIPLAPDEVFLRRWIKFRGTVRPRCEERGVRGSCDSLLWVLGKLNPEARFTFSGHPLVLHIEVISFYKGFFILPAKCDSLDSLYSSPSLMRGCVKFVKEEASSLGLSD